MATSSDNKEYFLVSDSNEINSQLDSKKMDWDELRNLAESNLFKKHLGILDNYLTVSQYDIESGAYRVTFGGGNANVKLDNVRFGVLPITADDVLYRYFIGGAL